jgi:DNA-3-methyladenine glycosylase II
VERIAITLDPLPPFRLDLTVWTLRRRPDNLMDRWDGDTYRRVLVLPAGPAAMTVTQAGGMDAPRLHVTAEGARLADDTATVIGATLERMLGLRTDLAAFYAFAAADPRLGPLARRFRGVKPPRLPSVFEALVNAIACQQITLTQGIRLLNRLTAAYGEPAPADAGDAQAHAPAQAFPLPARLAALSPEALKPLGFSQQKGRALVELAGAITSGDLDPRALAGLDDAAAVARLLQLRGVGRWTAEYVLLRGLGRTHIFPGDDVGARNNLRRWLELPDSLDYAGVRQALGRWREYGGLIYFHLLLDRLASAGYLGV